MIITIDISQIIYQTGVSRYTRQLVRHLLELDRTNQYQLFAGTFRGKRQIELFAEELRDDDLKFKLIIKNFPPQLAKTIWNQFHIIPIENFVGHTDIFHTSDWTQPPALKAKKITTIHDLTPLLFPNYHQPSLVANFKRHLSLTQKESSHIICVSQSTQKDLLNHTQINPSQTSLIYNGVEDAFKPASVPAIKNLKTRLGISQKYLLSVATLEPRKNILRLIKAFVSLNLADYQLVLAGKPGWGSLSLPQADNIIYPGFISDRDLPTLYSGADFFVYPSLYEGFGLPVLEAMACGTPVITSNISSLPEIVGQAGLLINPKSQTELETAILKLVKTPNLCRQYSKKGIVKARQFNWPACAQKTLDLYHQVYKPK